MIQLYFNKGDVFIYDVKDWSVVRKTLRLLSSCTNSQRLPIKLLHEEALLLLDKQLAVVVQRESKVTAEHQAKFKQFEDELLDEEQAHYKHIRKRQLELIIDDIVAAKRSKGDERSSEEIFEDELNKSSHVGKDTMIWPIFTTAMCLVESKPVEREQILEKTTELKYKVFKDLWEKGYFITSGEKFGADFLVYLGDPVAYHAIFIVHCVCSDAEQSLHSTEIVTIGRLATTVKKRAVLASLNNDEVAYITINWIDA